MIILTSNLNGRVGFFRSFLPAMALGCGLLASLSPAGATVIFDNLGTTPADPDNIQPANTGAQRFKATDVGELSSIVLKLGTITGGGTETFTLKLYSDAATGGLNGGPAPDTALATLASVQFQSLTADANNTFSPGAYDLSANTYYWIVAQATADGVRWMFDANDLQNGSGAGFDAHSAVSGNSGTTWNDTLGYPYLMSLELTAVPEPGTWLAGGFIALFAAGQVGMGFLKRRKAAAAK